MRIGLFTDFYFPHLGGVGTAVWNHYLALKSLGHEVVIVCPDYSKRLNQEVDVLRLAVLKGIVINGHPQAKIGLKNQNLLAGQHFNVVHSHSQGSVALLGAWYAQTYGSDFIQTYHYNSVAWYLSKPSLVMKYIKSSWLYLWFRWQKARLGLHSIAKINCADSALYIKWLWQGTLVTAPYAKRLAVPSLHFLEVLRSVFSSEKYLLVPNAVDVALYASIFSNSIAPIRILWVGRLSAEKRPLEFLASILALRQLTKARFEVNMIGDGQLLSDVRNYLRANNLNEVKALGGMPYEDVCGYYQRSDIFVVSSYGVDNQPMVIAEASAAGLLVVLSDDRLADQVCPIGRFVAKDSSVDALAEAMSLAMKKKTKNSTKPILHFARQNYGLSVLADRLVDTYCSRL